MVTALRIVAWAAGVACLAGLAYFSYAHFFAQQDKPGSPASGKEALASDFSSEPPAAGAGLRTAPAGMREYRSEAYHLSLFYPDTLTVASYDEGGGASTISFQDAAAAEGFQIFIVPYGEAQVSAERFAQDEPSGVRQSPLGITIDGAVGTSFYSTNEALGETAEIWFIRGGYLYEVTAPKSQAAWLSSIMATWQFI